MRKKREKHEEMILLQVQRGTYYTEVRKNKMLAEVTLQENVIDRLQDIMNISAKNISIKYYYEVL